MEWHATGMLIAQPALEHRELLAPPVIDALGQMGAEWTSHVGVAQIDPALADTAEFCARYGVAMEASANCVVIRGKRGGEVRFAACMVLATTRADVNGAVRRRLDARTASFAPMDEAVALSGMEYGGITPIGLPADWPILIDAAVARAGEVVIGSGIRGSKLFLPGGSLGVAAERRGDRGACPTHRMSAEADADPPRDVLCTGGEPAGDRLRLRVRMGVCRRVLPTRGLP